MSIKDQENRWHLDKRVPISIIIVLMMQAAAGLWAIADIKKDVELLKAGKLDQREREMGQRDRDERQDKSTTDSLMLVRSDIQDLGRKLDRLIERTAK